MVWSHGIVEGKGISSTSAGIVQSGFVSTSIIGTPFITKATQPASRPGNKPQG